MGLNIEVKGDVPSLHMTVRQLRALATSVQGSAMVVRRAGADSGHDWHGHAGDEFRSLTKRAEGKIGEFGERITALSQELRAYADDLAEVKELMRQACEVAVRGGLDLSATTIGDPGAPPSRDGAEGVGGLLAVYALKVRAITGAGSVHLTKTMRMAEKYIELDGFQKRTGTKVPWMSALDEKITTRFKTASWLNAGVMTKGLLQHLPQTGLVITTLGVEYDIAVLKKDPVPAVVSGYGGYVVGAATGALLIWAGVGVVPAALLGFGASLWSGFEIEELMK